ncbi:MAG: hypothetical protein HY748_02790 [Elusimicrobia bacterium]|nr:hypothetical protein [Elusimicrobiota bacterium]
MLRTRARVVLAFGVCLLGAPAFGQGVPLSLELLASAEDLSFMLRADQVRLDRPVRRPGSSWISDQTASAISRRVWLNESGGTVEGLTFWGAGEGFASLGIGHFIWYPAGVERPFGESFTRLLAYFEKRGAVLSDWLKNSPACPWPDREAFRRDLRTPRMLELRKLLHETVGIQARFMADRLEEALPRILRAAKPSSRSAVRRRFLALASQPEGLYALIDYVNFKGEGLYPQERYNNIGWGLLQVLDDMRGYPEGEKALKEFSRSARRMLWRRVLNSPPERNEMRWVAGWRKRVKGYARLRFKADETAQSAAAYGPRKT